MDLVEFKDLNGNQVFIDPALIVNVVADKEDTHLETAIDQRGNGRDPHDWRTFTVAEDIGSVVARLRPESRERPQ